MPTRTLTIPLRTLQVGSTTFGPLNIQANVTQAKIVTDRTVAGGLNSLTSDSTVAVAIEISQDGTNWRLDAGATWVGGIITNRNGQLNSDFLSVGGLDDPNANQLRVTVTVAGPSPVAIAGTITTTS